AVGAHAALSRRSPEGAVDDVHRHALPLLEGAHGRAAEIRAGGVAAVAGEAGVHDLEPAAPVEDGPASAAVGDVRRQTRRVAVGEGEVLHGQLRILLVLAVRGGPALRLVAGVQVEDPARAAAAE